MRSTLSLRCTYRSDLFLGSGNLSRNRNRLTNHLAPGTPLNRNELGWRNWSLSRSSLCNNSSRGHGLSHDIFPIKEAFHRHAHSNRNFPTRGVINRKGLRFNLKKKKKRKGRERKMVDVKARRRDK